MPFSSLDSAVATGNGSIRLSGSADEADNADPANVVFLAGGEVTAGAYFSFALLDDGTVVGSGLGFAAQLGRNQGGEDYRINPTPDYVLYLP